MFTKCTVVTIPVTPLQQNCSLLIDEATKKAVVVDPGGDVDTIVAEVRKRGLTVEGIWLTHSHFDHVGGVAECLAEWQGAPLLGHQVEREFRDRVPEIAAMWSLQGFAACPEPSQYISGGETLYVGKIPCSVLFVPGHSPGHVAFYFKDSGLLIAGDTVFQGLIGRTDLPFGDHAQLIASIKREILSLPDDVLVFPGHGPSTTVGEERRSNPFLS